MNYLGITFPYKKKRKLCNRKKYFLNNARQKKLEGKEVSNTNGKRCIPWTLVDNYKTEENQTKNVRKKEKKGKVIKPKRERSLPCGLRRVQSPKLQSPGGE